MIVVRRVKNEVFNKNRFNHYIGTLIFIISAYKNQDKSNEEVIAINRTASREVAVIVCKRAYEYYNKR